MVPTLSPTQPYQDNLKAQSATENCLLFLAKLNPFLGIFILYIATTSSNLSITHDSIVLYKDMVSGNTEFYPNKLLFTNILLLLIAPFETVFNTAQSLQIVQAIAGALSLHIFYRLLVDRLQISTLLAAGVVSIATFSYGFWYYSVALEVYIFPLCLLLMSFYILSGNKTTVTTIAAAALLHSLATLLHQSGILFSFVVVAYLFVSIEVPFQERLKRFFLYVLVCTVTVGGAYLVVASNQGQLNSIADFINWMKGTYEGDYNHYSVGINSVILAMVGFVRAIVSINFILALEEPREIITTMFHTNSLQDEVFLVRNLNSFMVYLLFFMSFVAAVCLSVLTYLAVRGAFIKKQFASNKVITMIIAWLLPYTIFFIQFNPSNADFWMTQLLLTLALVAFGINRLPKYRKPMSGLLFIAAGGLMLVNGIGTVLPAMNPKNDLYREIAIGYNDLLGPDDLLVVADHWPLLNHIYHYGNDQVHEQVYDLGTAFAIGKSVEQATADITLRELQINNSAGTVYFSPDVLSLTSASVAYYGIEYAEYSSQFASSFCEPSEVRIIDGFKAYRMDCAQ